MSEERTVLTEKQVEQIAETMEKLQGESPSYEMLKDIPSNTGVEYHEPEQGEQVLMEVKINPETGEHTPIARVEIPGNTSSFEERINALSESLDKESEEREIEVEDITTEILSDTTMGDFSSASIEDIKQIHKCIKAYKAGDPVKFKDLPEFFKNGVNRAVMEMGGVPMGENKVVSSHYNSFKNTLAEEFISELVTNIEMEKFNFDFQNKIEEIYKEADNELSPYFKDYNDNQRQHLERARESVKDESKKKLITDIIEAIDDACILKRFKDKAKRIKIKDFDIQKPQRMLTSFYTKYSSNNHKIFDLGMCIQILDRHLKKNGYIDKNDMKSSIKFILAFCKLCQNYDSGNRVQHSFMYYFTYNITLLDIYKNDDYDKYQEIFLGNVKEVLDLLK